MLRCVTWTPVSGTGQLWRCCGGVCLWGSQLRETAAETVTQRTPFLQDLLSGPSDPSTPMPPADTRPALLPTAQGQHWPGDSWRRHTDQNPS